MEKYLKLQSDIKQELAAVQKAQADAIPPEVILPMKIDLGKKVDIYRRLTVLLGQKKFPPSTGTVPTPSSQPPAPGIAVPASTTTDSNPSNPVPPAPEASHPPLSSNPAAEPQNPNIPNPTLPAKESYPTEVMAQIHRLMQQQNQQQGILSRVPHPFSLSPACRCHHTIACGE
jgi:hypothetical protein